MSTQLKLIIPLLDENLSPDLFTPEAGFINAYSADINRPFLDNHIFLMYDADLSSYGNFYRNEKIMSMSNLYNRIFVRIKGILLMIYTFCIVNKAIRHILDGRIFLTNEEKYDILTFWNRDEDVCMSLITSTVLGNISNAVVPEQDYQSPKTERPAPFTNRQAESVYFFIV